MIRNIYRLYMCLFVAIGLFHLQNLSATENAVRYVNFDFTDVAQKGIPAIVTIKIQAISNHGSYFYDQDETGPFDPFEQFRREFFGRQYEQQQKQRPNRPIQVSQGSGFLISPNGYIMTNNHVIQHADEVTIVLNDGREFTAEVIGKDPQTDLAVLKIDANNLPFLEFGNSDDLQVGQWVVAIGSPFGLQASLTVGVVSAKGRNSIDLNQIEDFIQTDAAINRGNSGGPLLNLEGKVVGINTAMVGSASNLQNTGVGFAIPSNLAEQVMNQLIESGEVTRGFIGVLLQGVDKDLAEAFSLSKQHGALVAEVTKDSPAERAGLKQGDLILKYNGKQIDNIATLRNAIAGMSPNATVNLTIQRNNMIIEVPVTLMASPDASVKNNVKMNKLGFSVEDITTGIDDASGHKPGDGVVISKVVPGSPAEWAGLKKGTLIVSVNQERVDSAEKFNSIIEQANPGRPILLLVKQGNVTRFISLKVG